MTYIIWAHRQPEYAVPDRLLQGHGLRYMGRESAEEHKVRLTVAFPDRRYRLRRGSGWGKNTWILRQETVS